MRLLIPLIFLFLSLGQLSAQPLPKLIPYRKGDLWGLSDTAGRIVVKPQYKWMDPWKFAKGNKTFYLDQDNHISKKPTLTWKERANKRLKSKFASIRYWDSNFGSVARLKHPSDTSRPWVYIDTNGNWKIPNTFAGISNYGNGDFYITAFEKFHEEIFLYTFSGQLVSKFSIPKNLCFESFVGNNFTELRDTGKCWPYYGSKNNYIINVKGKIIDSFRSSPDTTFSITQNGQYAILKIGKHIEKLIDSSGRTILQGYKNLIWAGQNIWAKKNDTSNYQLLDTKGNLLKIVPFKECIPISTFSSYYLSATNDFFWMKEKSNSNFFYLVDRNGNYKSKQLNNFACGFISWNRLCFKDTNGKYGFLDTLGQIVIPAEYDLRDVGHGNKQTAFYNGMCQVIYHGKMILVDIYGRRYYED